MSSADDGATVPASLAIPAAEGVPGRSRSLNVLRGYLTPRWRPAVLLILSAILAVLYLIGRPYILFNDGDPLTYFRKAWWFIGHAGGADVPSRGPGYPIWLILTGAAWLHTWWPLALSHIAMAIVAPMLVYGILAPISRNAGFAAGLLFAAFGISYMHMNWIMTEELFLFMELVSLLLISWHLCDAWTPAVPPASAFWTARLRYGCARFVRSPYAIALALAYTTMVKPAAGPFFWLFVMVCLLFRVQPWKRYVGPVLLYAAIMTTWATYDYRYSPVRFPMFGMPANKVQRNFADVYYGNGFGAINGWTPTPPHVVADLPQAPPTIGADKGPASQRLYQAVATHVKSLRGSGKWNVTHANSAYQLYGRYDDRQLVSAVFLRPNPFYYQLVIAAAEPAGGDRLLRDVAREHGNSGVTAYFKYLARHPTVVLIGPPNPYVGFMFFMKFYRYRDFIVNNYVGMRNLFLGGYRGNLVIEENGPGTRAYAQSIRFMIDALPQFVFAPGNDYVDVYGGLEAFKIYAIENPYFSKYSGSMMGDIYQWMFILYGEQGAGKLMGAAGMESMMKNSAGAGMVFGDFLAALAYSGTGYYLGMSDVLTRFPEAFAGMRTLEHTLLTATVESGAQNQLPPALGRHVGVVRDRSEFSKSAGAMLLVCYGMFKWFKPILFMGMVVFSVPLLMTGVGGRLVAFLAPAYALSAAAFTVVMIMPGSDPRHEEVYAFFALLITVLGLSAVPQFLRKMFGGPRPQAARTRSS